MDRRNKILSERQLLELAENFYDSEDDLEHMSEEEEIEEQNLDINNIIWKKKNLEIDDEEIKFNGTNSLPEELVMI
jgi:CRISPR/Cas system CSM-associated protein Csm4 (group 5 of RAMP superfamily)